MTRTRPPPCGPSTATTLWTGDSVTLAYQYLVDEAGRTYEGRWSGNDGDPAHDAAGLGVTGAHVGGYNSGNVAMALLGTLTDSPPKPAAQGSLEDLLVDLGRRHGIDPQGSGTYTNPVNGATWTGPHVPGHRDWAATECPGGAFYELLPVVRANAAAKMAGASPSDTTSPSISDVRAENVSRTSASIRWSTNEAATSQVKYWVSGSSSVLDLSGHHTADGS